MPVPYIVAVYQSLRAFFNIVYELSFAYPFVGRWLYLQSIFEFSPKKKKRFIIRIKMMGKINKSTAETRIALVENGKLLDNYHVPYSGRRNRRV